MADNTPDGDKAYKIITGPAVSSDPAYHNLNPDDVDVINRDYNDPPTITSGNTASVPENTTTSFLTVQATDPNGDNLTYQITGGADSGFFSVVLGTGELRFQIPADYENPADANGDNVYEVEVSASDAHIPAGTDSQTILVTVTDVDDTAPADPTAAPDLTTDTGANTTDNITSNNTPSFDVQCTEAGASITLYSDNPANNTVIGTHTCSGTGTESVTASTTLADGAHNISYTVKDSSGNESAPSPELPITIDTSVPTTPTINSPANNTETNNSTPVISGSGTAGDNIVINDSNGNQVCATTVNSDGS